MPEKDIRAPELLAQWKKKQQDNQKSCKDLSDDEISNENSADTMEKDVRKPTTEQNVATATKRKQLDEEHKLEFNVSAETKDVDDTLSVIVPISSQMNKKGAKRRKIIEDEEDEDTQIQIESSDFKGKEISNNDKSENEASNVIKSQEIKDLQRVEGRVDVIADKAKQKRELKKLELKRYSVQSVQVKIFAQSLPN